MCENQLINHINIPTFDTVLIVEGSIEQGICEQTEKKETASTYCFNRHAARIPARKQRGSPNILKVGSSGRRPFIILTHSS